MRRFALNLNTGAMYLEEGEVGRVAHTAILHDTERPPAILLLIVEPE
ncbi:MAG: hypothetical protein P8189_25260 [Anaerolineae bacterium]